MDNGIISLEKHLNEISAAELEKEVSEIDCSTVDECTAALLRMEPASKYDYDKQIEERLFILLQRRRTTKKALRIILVAALLAAVIAGCAFGYISKHYESGTAYYKDHVEILFGKSEKNKSIGGINIAYIPVGFDLQTQIINKHIASVEYSDKNGRWMVIVKCGSFSNFSVSSEKYPNSIRQFEYNGKTYTSFQTDENFFGITWIYDEFRYEIDGHLPVEELLKIAEGVS